MNSKLASVRKELNDLKINYQMKCKEIEQLTKEISDLKDPSKASPYGSTKDAEIKKLQEEIQRLKSLNKHRDDIINQIES